MEGDETSKRTVRFWRPSSKRLWLVLAPALGALTAGGVALGAARSDNAAQTEEAAGPEGMGGPGHHMMRLLDKVNATPDQRNQIQGIWKGLRPQLKAARQQHEAVRQQIVAALSGPTIDPAAVEKLRQQSMSWEDKTSSLFTQGMVASAQVLTPDQRKTAAQEFQQQHHAHHFGPPSP